MFQKFRNPVSGLTHFVAAVAAVAGLAGLLYLGRTDGAKESRARGLRLVLGPDVLRQRRLSLDPIRATHHTLAPPA